MDYIVVCFIGVVCGGLGVFFALHSIMQKIKEKEKKYITALERERVLSQDAKALAEASDRLLKQRQENNQRSKGFFSNWFSYSEPDSRSSKNTFGFIGD